MGYEQNRWVQFSAMARKPSRRRPPRAGRPRYLLLIRRSFAHVQKQRFEHFGLEQRAEMIGGKMGVVAAEQFQRPCMPPGTPKLAPATR